MFSFSILILGLEFPEGKVETSPFH